MKKTQERLYIAKANMSSIENQLVSQQAQMKMANVMQKSAQVMQYMNNLVKIPELQDVAQKMGAEMSRMELIDEMMGDAMDDAMGDVEEEAEEEVERVLAEITLGMDIEGVVVKPDPV